MEFANPLKAVPSRWYLPLALLGGGLLAWRFLSGGSDTAESPTSSSMGYDPALVALGVQTSLERDKLNAQTELGKLAMKTELDAIGLNNANEAMFASYADKANERDYLTANNAIGSQERMYGGDLTLRNIELSVEQALGMAANETERENARQAAWATTESARLEADAKVNAAKASKKKGFSFGKFSLSI